MILKEKSDFMDRVFLKIGSFNIYWYSVLIVTSVIIGYYFSVREAKKNGLTKNFISDLVFYLVIVSILGARIYYVIFDFNEYKDNLLDIFKIWEGGIAIYGAVISAIIFIMIYSKKKEKNYLLVLDTLVPYLIFGQALGRWGNFFNKEAHGTITTLGHLHRLHLPNFIIILLLIIRKKDQYKHTGTLLFTYFIWYGIGRFIIEGMRTDSLYFLGLRISQIVSIILIIIGIIGLIRIVIKNKRK